MQKTLFGLTIFFTLVLGLSAIMLAGNAPLPPVTRWSGFAPSVSNARNHLNLRRVGTAAFVPQGYRPGRERDGILSTPGHYRGRSWSGSRGFALRDRARSGGV